MNRTELLQRAEALAPILAARAAETDALRRLFARGAKHVVEGVRTA